LKKEYDFSAGRRGAIDPMPAGKTRITIRLDKEIIDWFRYQVDSQGGGNYQTMINNALKEYIYDKKQNFEDVIRHVLREELARLRMPNAEASSQSAGKGNVSNVNRNRNSPEKAKK